MQTVTVERAEHPDRRLVGFPVIDTHGLEEARDAVTRVHLPHDLTADGERLDMTLNAVADQRFTLGSLTYRATTRLVMPPAENCNHVNLTTAGQTDADRTDGARERTLAEERGLVLSPVQRNTVRWTPEAEQLLLEIPRASLETHLGALLGRAVTEVLDFGFGLDLTIGPGKSLLRAVRFLADELDRPDGLARMPLAREQLEAYMATHADEPLTPQELARVGCMSVRTLHASFQQTFGEAPMAYLRRLRLDQVRGELLRSEPTRVRVTDVAVKWGSFHQSRFAQQYRERFGELPSCTLRR